MRLVSSRVKQELVGYATGGTLLVSIISVIIIVGGLELPDQAKNVVNGMATALILLMAFMARSHISHRAKFAHVMQIFENEKNAWEIHGVVDSIIPLLDKDPEYVEYADTVKRFNLQNNHVYGVKYRGVTVFGKQSFNGEEFDFHYAIISSPVPLGQLYGEGIKHEIIDTDFPASPNCALLTVNILERIKVPKVKGVTDEDWIPVFFVRHGPYYSEGLRRFQALPVASQEILEAGKILAGRLVSIQIEGKLIEREEKAREEGVRMGEDLGAAQVKRFRRGVEPGLQIPSPKTHKKGYFIIGVLATLLVVGYLLGWLRLG